MSQSVNWSTSINVPINDPVKQSVNDPISEFVNHSVSNLVNKSVTEHSVSDPVNKSVGRSVNDPIGKSVNQLICDPVSSVIRHVLSPTHHHMTNNHGPSSLIMTNQNKLVLEKDSHLSSIIPVQSLDLLRILNLKPIFVSLQDANSRTRFYPITHTMCVPLSSLVFMDPTFYRTPKNRNQMICYRYHYNYKSC